MSMNSVMFSIIVVCLNAGDELNKTVESVLCQTCRDYEIIVKDGGSSDGSIQKLPEDERIRLVQAKDTGIYDAMNQASRDVRGRYVIYLNCGDYFASDNVLEELKWEMCPAGEVTAADDMSSVADLNQTREMCQPGEDESRVYIYYGDIIERKTGSCVSSNPSLDEFALYRNIPCHQACFYDSSLIKMDETDRAYVYDTSLPVRADYDHFLWCIYVKKAVPKYVPITVCSYEGGGFSETKENARKAAKEHKLITAKYMPKASLTKYKMIMILTLQPIRAKLAGSKTFAKMYQGLKSKLYS